MVEAEIKAKCMFNLYKVCVFICLIFSNISFCQETKMSGIITDNLKKPIEMANVIAINKNTNKIASYSITNVKGNYNLILDNNINYIIKISFLGFKTVSYELLLDEKTNNFQKNFSLEEDTTLLNDVVITYEMPIRISGDTISYKADAFTNGTERKLGDVLKKLPAIEINADGQVEIEGNQIKKVMIDGKDFFDGDSKLAVQNIPADAIDKIEVLKNFTEVSQLKNVTNNMDNYALNIKLKEGKKKFWFGDINLGAGLDERYVGNPKLFYYSPEKSINIISNINNIGQIPFTRRDYFTFTGGFRNLSGGSGTGANLITDNLDFSSLKDNKAKEITTKFTAANFSYTSNKALSFSGYFIFNDTKTDMAEITNKTLLNGDTELTESNVLQKTTLGLAKLSSLYKPNKNFQLDYDVFFKLSKQSEDKSLSTLFLNQKNNTDIGLKDKPFSIDQNLNLYHTINDKNIISAEGQYLISKEYPFYSATFLDLGNNPTGLILPFSSLLPYDTNQNNYILNQEKFIITNKLDVKTDYYYVFNKKSNLQFTIGTILNKQQFNSSLFQILDNNIQNNFEDPQFNNDTNYTFFDSYLSTHYRIVIGKLTLNTGLNIHNYDLSTNQLTGSNSIDEVRFLPDFSAIYQFKKSESIRFNYSLTAQYPDVNSVEQGYVLKNYNSLYKGNPFLEEGVFENYRFSYSSFSLFNYTNVLANFSYSKKNNPIKNQLQFIGNNTISTSINSTLADEIFSGNLNWEKTFLKKYKVNLKAKLSLSNSYNTTETNIIKSEETKQIYTTSVSSNYKKWPNFEIGYTKTLNDYQLDTTKSNFLTDNFFSNVKYAFLPGFQLNIDYNYYNYSNKVQSLNTYSFLDSSISYQKKESKWEYQIAATNVLNTSSINENKLSDSFTSTSNYLVQPRYITISLKYNF